MPLEPEKRERLQAWIGSKVVRRHCPACEHAVDWDVADMLELSLAPCDEAGGIAVPVVPLVCPNCGYVTLFSAKRIGLCDEG